MTPVCRFAGGGYAYGSSEVTIFQYEMPDDGGYVLQPNGTFFLPITGGSGPDVAPGSSLLWMATGRKVRSSTGLPDQQTTQ
jgi:hypothetical protein